MRDALAEREREARARSEHQEAVALLAGAERAQADQDVRRDHQPPASVDHVAEPADREILAAALHDVADEETVEARVVAATNQVQPASEAITTPPQRAPRARPARRAARSKDRSRSR